MTVSSTTTKSGPYNGNGATKDFAYGFRILAEADLEVVLKSALGVETVLVLGTHYTVSGVGEDAGGAVTMVTAPAVGEKLTIRRKMGFKQETDLENQAAYNAQTVEDSLDRLTMHDIQQQEELDRTVKRAVSSTSTADLTLPEPVAGKAIGWSDDGTKLVNDPSDNASAVAAAAASAAASGASAAAAAISETNAAADAAAAHADRLAADADAAATAADRAQVATDKASTHTDRLAADASTAAAAVSETNAQTYKNNAAASAAAALVSENAAAAAQVAAEAARDTTLSAFDSFDDRYLGAKAADPALDNDGNALVAGALYFNTVAGGMKVYTGSAWVAAYISGSGYLAAANNLSDVVTPATALANLGGQPLDATLTALAGLVVAANKLIYATGVDTFSTTDLTAFIRTLLDDADATTARATLGLVLGIDVQAYHARLAALAGVAGAADKLPYCTGANTMDVTALSAFARTLLDDADAAAARATLGISGGAVNFQSFSASGTFTIPAANVKVIVIGPGGAGGNDVSSGGSGGTAIKYLSGLTVGQTLTVTIGTPGNNTTVSSGTATISTITGGYGGAPNDATQLGGAGGSASGGDINLSGQNGFGQPSISASTGGFPGGSAPYGGSGGRGGAYNGNGDNGQWPGGGGGGGGSVSGSAGSGANGGVFFEWVA